MKYMGSKAKIAGDILPIVLAERREGQAWVEPFVGGGNIIERVTGPRVGSDSFVYAVEALISIRDHVDELPKDGSEFGEEDYKKLRNPQYQHPHKGYLGHALSYGGKWLGGWRRDSGGERDYVAESYRAAVKQSARIQGVGLIHQDYSELKLPPKSLVYCDPPYAGTTKYTNRFDSEKFWEWCREAERDGHTVFVSEYSAPEDFELVWWKDVNSSLTKDTGAKRARECLFRWRN